MESVIKALRDTAVLGSSPRQGWQRKSIGFDAEQNYLQLMFTNVVLGDPETGVKRSNSVIIYGPPGVGKTTLVESALAKLDKDEAFCKSRFVIRLNGLICSDFRTSVSDICWQLDLENPFNDECQNDEDVDGEGEEEGNEGEAAAVIGDPETRENLREIGRAKSFDDQLEHMIIFLKTNMEKLNQSVIFILDKLDRFAEHPNQRLLYILYDLVANSKSTVPISVVGVTDRVDVLELFEKRVKSRFSHRNINLLPKYNFTNYLKITKRLISFPDHSINDPKIPPLKGDKKEWNQSVSQLLENNRMKQILQAVFDADPTILKLTSFLFSVLTAAKSKLTVAQFEVAYQENLVVNDHVTTALNLPITELLALLAIYKQVQNKKQQAWQPASLYKIVEKVMASFSLGKEEFLKAMTKLEFQQLIVPVSNAQRNIGGVNNVADIYYKCELSFREFQDIWKKYPNLPSSFKEFV